MLPAAFAVLQTQKVAIGIIPYESAFDRLHAKLLMVENGGKHIENWKLSQTKTNCNKNQEYHLDNAFCNVTEIINKQRKGIVLSAVRALKKNEILL